MAEKAINQTINKTIKSSSNLNRETLADRYETGKIWNKNSFLKQLPSKRASCPGAVNLTGHIN
ncbi:hypothetical protein HJG54_15770 [Leptolyngbya sp. NK1-12]|uniref:Uncharacterized protein n=1 Tax=Leptolyngbya sp. NK1-12 TaxID=2547451 RepID=A0AA97AQU2_9CYAN|nr:hypothetical protein [Leptolyngbya sp. NK1-12]WNZ24168.1 hypothetical protein HJG54_15770 [Leptolyngbya sp. NK1-12]